MIRYVSDLNISFSIQVNGKDRRIRFSPRMNGGSTYLAETDEEVKALEASSMFNRVYYRAPGQVIEESTSGKKGRKKAEDKFTEVGEVSSWQEAREYLVDKFGSDFKSLTTPDSILAEASAKKVTFPNLK